MSKGAGLLTGEVLEQSGLTWRQIGYAIEHGYFQPTHPGKGSGDPHRFSDRDLVICQTASVLLASGVMAHAAWRAARTATERTCPYCNGLGVVPLALTREEAHEGAQ